MFHLLTIWPWQAFNNAVYAALTVFGHNLAAAFAAILAARGL